MQANLYGADTTAGAETVTASVEPYSGVQQMANGAARTPAPDA